MSLKFYGFHDFLIILKKWPHVFAFGFFCFKKTQKNKKTTLKKQLFQKKMQKVSEAWNP